MSLICPAVSVAQICKRLGIANYIYVLLAFLVLYVCAIIAAAVASQFMDGVVVLLTLGTIVSIARLRWRIRFLFSLPGSPVEDCFYSTFCGWCTIAQMATQVESYVPGSCDFTPRNTLEGYTFA
jgi:Cys-rich protein (TIGR01571 family)